VRGKSKVAKAKAEELREAVYDRVKEWPERMGYAQLDELALALGCELFAGGIPVYASGGSPDARDYLSLAYDAQAKAKDFVKARGFVFSYGGAVSDYRNATKVSAEVVARWKSEKASRIKSENAKAKAETERWWANLAPNLKASLEEAWRSNPRRRIEFV
jgi:predicted Zn-dependent peptidase